MKHKIELHAHTAQSSPCGAVPAEELIRLYVQAGYSGVVITDHFRLGYSLSAQDDPDVQLHKFLSGYEAASRAGGQLGIKVYLGAEITFVDFPNWDFLLYGVTEDFLRQSLPYLTGTPADFYSFAHKNGVLVVRAHPFRYETTPPDKSFIDGVEAYNLPDLENNSHNDLALQFAQENQLLQTSGSDAHRLTHIGHGGICTDILPEDVFALRDLLLSGKYVLITGEK